MTKATIPQQVSELRTIYAESASARAILDDFASRTNNQRTTEVDQLLGRLERVPKIFVARPKVIAFFRKLESLGFGRFIEGRRGHPSRFVWTSDQVGVGKAARAEAVVIPQVQNAEPTERSFEELRTYHFPLRTGTDVTLELPADLTDKEAERLGLFLKTLALATDQ